VCVRVCDVYAMEHFMSVVSVGKQPHKQLSSPPSVYQSQRKYESEIRNMNDSE